MGVAVASSGAPSKIARNLGSSGLEALFEAQLVVSAAHVARGKPVGSCPQGFGVGVGSPLGWALDRLG